MYYLTLELKPPSGSEEVSMNGLSYLALANHTADYARSFTYHPIIYNYI